MGENRKVNDRNLVVFGIPDVPVEKEISYIQDELARRPVVQDAPRVKTKAPTPTAAPAPAPFVINGLTTSPQLHMQSYVYISDNVDNTSSMGIDVDDELGYGAGTIWFLSRGSAGTGSTLAGGPASFSLCYVDPSTQAVTMVLDSVIFTIFNGYADDRRMFFADGKLVLAEISNVDKDMQVFDPSLPNWGCTVSGSTLVPAQTSSNSGPSAAWYPTSLTISGTKYIMSSYGDVYNPATDTWSVVLGPDGINRATSYVSSGAYMWCNDNFDLYSAPASLTPTWTLRNTDNIALNTDDVAVMPNTGELIVAKNFATSPALRRGISSYDFTTGTKTDKTGIFSATGLPDTTSQFSGTADVEPNLNQFRVECADNLVIFTGGVRSDALGTTVYASHQYPTDKMWARAVWYLKGSGSGLASSATRVAETDVSGWPSSSAGADTWRNHPYSTAAVNGTTLYTWVGGTMVQEDTDTVPSGDLTVQVESWIREHNI